MASASSTSKVDSMNGPPRTSSIDSAISAISSRAPSQQSSQDATNDINNLVRAAGSPEAVIQYLLKEKQSQSQQNTQLWRLLDKQRAMILGLNKDLERALKDKEKYRRKLKEIVAIHDDQSRLEFSATGGASLPNAEVEDAKTSRRDGPPSPSILDSDSARHSPVDLTLAPYPITPPADRMPDERSSKAKDMLDPTPAMPKPSEHALDHFDHEEQDRAIEEAKAATNAAYELPFHVGIPPSRSLPSQPPNVPQPKPPTVSVIEATPLIDQGISLFPPPSAPPPRKPPPAPLHLGKESSTGHDSSADDNIDSESDYDSILGVDELPVIETRGRRRTREDDDYEREVIAQQEAEARSLSKKSKKGSRKGTPVTKETQPGNADVPVSPRTIVPQAPIARDHIPASLAGLLSGNETRQNLHPALMSPGLPSSPRPMAFSPPLSPRGMASTAMPLSPRAPRQPIPLPPSTPKFGTNSFEQLNPTSPKPAHVSKEDRETQRTERTERREVYKGLATEEYPDLLLPPNALPSISVKVASSRMKPSRASLLALTQLDEDPVFTLAVLSRSDGEELWRVEKDTSSLAKLDQRMKTCPSFTAKTPDRSLFSGHAPAKLDARRMVLEAYLDELLDTPLDMATAIELCKYLSTNTLAPNIDDHALPNDGSGDASTPKKGPGGRPLKTGYLTKRGKNFGGWKARYFVLDGPNLKYYEAPGGAHLGTIKLQNAQIGRQASQNSDGSAGGAGGEEPDNQYRHAFLVLEPKKKDSNSLVKHVLCAESDRERDQWVEALLRWINYRDSIEDGPSQKSGQHSNQPHVTGVNAKKQLYGQGKFQDQRTGSQDALIGVSYDSAKQGDVPDGAPLRHRGTASPEPPEKQMSSMYAISAPRDPVVISDSASWGSKTNLLAPGPSMEEKKQRKRSFFGFGPKARSSTDDQDIHYNSSGGSTPQPQTEFREPVRQAFGAPLAEAVRFCGPADVDVPLPAVIYRCIQYLDLKNAIAEEGIFRLSGSNVVIRQLRDRFDQEGDVNLLTDETYYDIHVVASLLKLYLRELPTTILTRELHMQFVSVTEMSNHREKIKALAELVQRLPLANETLLKYLTAFLIKIINHSDMNKMTVRNVGIVFSPTLNIPAPFFALLLQNYRGIFGIEPEDYELPSSASMSGMDSRAPAEQQPRRPSTAGQTDSSLHHPRLAEQMQQRSTTTPPPNLSGLALRPSATPPPRQSYDPQYMAHQGSRTLPTERAAYENGSDPPAGYDPTVAVLAPAFRQPTYDRPHYGYGSAYEQDYSENSNGLLDASFGNKSKRRESSMLMGNMLNQQPSNSRLREETRM